VTNSLSTRDADYLITVYELSVSRGIARVIDIAKVLGVSKSTASLMIKKLRKYGLVEKVGNGFRLSDTGLEACLEILWRHGVIEVALTRLGLDPEEACEVAREVELSIPKHVLRKLWYLLGEPKECSHGGFATSKAELIKSRSTCTCRFNIVRKYINFRASGWHRT